MVALVLVATSEIPMCISINEKKSVAAKWERWREDRGLLCDASRTKGTCVAMYLYLH